MTKVISIINYKGGVGKTTVTSNLAGELAFQGFKVLMIDLDPQTNLTFSFLRVEDWEKNFQNKTIKNWFDAFIYDDHEFNLDEIIISPNRVNLRLAELKSKGEIDLIASHLGLIEADLELSAKLWGGSKRTNLYNFLKVHSRLKEGLQQLDDEGYDVILIDCPPNFNIVTKTAIIASDILIIPAKSDYLSTIGMEQLKKNVDELVEEYNEKARNDEYNNEFSEVNPKFEGVVFTMVGIRSGTPYKAQQQFISTVRRLNIPVFNTIIRENKTLFSDAPQTGVPVVLEDVSLETYQNVREELEAFTQEVRERLGI
ncbi:AAA family ATPase [Paenibacillus sp. KS-LC4]|uniref:ParA family protein n=1 Tax=Paenibacillus sp. KS-LC4 TaxID=2979727 RepID=UPI0030CF1F8F